MNPGGKKKSVPINDIYPPFADNFAGFSGIFPGSSPDLNTPASSASLAPFSPINLLRRRVSFIHKKKAKNKKLLGLLDEIRRTSWLRKFLLA